VILYIPLFSCGDVCIRVVGIKICCNVAVALKAIPMLVFLNKAEYTKSHAKPVINHM